MQETNANGANDFSLVALLTILGTRKRWTLGFPLFFTTGALVYSFLAQPIYTSKALILPPQQAQSTASSLLASLGPLAGLAGPAVALHSPLDMYVAILRSRPVTDAVITKLALQRHYGDKSAFETRQRLTKNVHIDADKQTGLIAISTNDHDAFYAAAITNAEVGSLSTLLNHLAITDAQKRKSFFASEIKKISVSLYNADKRFRALSAAGGLPITKNLADANIRATAHLKALINAKEVELASLRNFATEANPGLARISAELAAMHTQLQKLQSGGARLIKSSPTGEDAVAALRTLETQQALMQVMLKQYEMAKIDEAKEGPLVQEIQSATPSQHRSGPKRALIIVASALLGFIFGSIAAVARHSYLQAISQPENSARFRRLREAWKL
jgi:uncharacterized protein involved in exopolysaccharide biosynthesis